MMHSPSRGRAAASRALDFRIDRAFHSILYSIPFRVQYCGIGAQSIINEPGLASPRLTRRFVRDWISIRDEFLILNARDVDVIVS